MKEKANIVKKDIREGNFKAGGDNSAGLAQNIMRTEKKNKKLNKLKKQQTKAKMQGSIVAKSNKIGISGMNESQK